ncbi:MAG: heat-inducible transcriptional repressor HrcA [Anaerovibrio sp.]|uniref:heat-inducible transcriptional repressor HrcA n=1 Tax=Anaerovibrio TaxID=82373 RepID=UPI0023F20A0E|nr:MULTISPECIES: heat-inducible transcriptional repressor HrcA [Anaerovibrio]MBQ2009231.1 heat-inducible transcription repressor HrcA [Selenomonadaceae bacterium]MBQ2410540.1 heat-inducible transcription repressor HrcA [Selenomonadaceae bacterium]MBQ5586441.1 heat-inducible transcription repressor HrcA [Selenomonadaceae bacterium]MBQ5651927.1 heat-inducible transcription repressor HrcA [Selenomonadaceae bacterium]MBQ5732979.1 heat-inducible transcription repressor HrcA [Selenomonadaceae bacter
MLDERKQRILQAVIQDYISSAEPVGSRTLARKYDLGVSPATIRNEMADLEMLGYLEHIHTSSGRVPSSKGYRLYVDSLLPVQPMTDAEKAMIDKWYKAKVQQLDQVFQETAKIISKLTRNVSLVLAPQISKAAFRCMQFLPLDDHRVIAVLMTDAGFVENRIMEMPAGSSFEDFQRMAKVINGCLAGHTLGAIQNGSLKQIEAEIGDNGLYESAMTLIDKALNSQRKERLYLGGTTEMMEQPEFHNVDKVKELLIMLEKDQLMKDILKAHLGDGLTVTIGQENEYSGIKDCSIITATYHLDGELLGSMAVLGPTRMEYGRTMSLLNYMNNNLTEVIKRLHW